MSVDHLRDRIADFAEDASLNLASMMADETLSTQSKYGLLLASAIAARNPIVTAARESAACVMATNNVYYRFVHLASISVWTEPISSCGHWQSGQSTGAVPAWTPMRRRCGNPASAPTQFKRPCALPRSCSQLRLRSRRQGMAGL